MKKYEKRSDTVLSVQSITRFEKGVRILHPMEFTLEGGECLAIIGPNGSGKTSLMKLISGLKSPDSGKITVFGYDMEKEGHKARSFTGFLVEDTVFYEDLTAEEHMKLVGVLRGGFDENESAALMQEFCILKKMDVPLKQFSKGEKKRLALCMALLGEPEILVLDHPYEGLDEAEIVLLTEALKERKKKGVSILIFSNHLQAVSSLADRVGLMKDGFLLRISTVEKLSKDNTLPSVPVLYHLENSEEAALAIRQVHEELPIEIIDKHRLRVLLPSEGAKKYLEEMNRQIMSWEIGIYTVEAGADEGFRMNFLRRFREEEL